MKKIFRQILNPFRILLSLFAGLLSSVLALLFAPFGYGGIIPRYIFSPMVLFFSNCHVKSFGRENLDTNTTYIFVANHESHFDIPAVCTGIERRINFIAKKELQRIPFFGWAVMAVGMIFIDRKNKEAAMNSMKKAGELIRNGRDVITFPEGTRTKTGKINQFKKGTFTIALESKVPIVPVAISGTREIIHSGGFLIKPGEIKVKIGQPILPATYEKMSAIELADFTQLKVIELVKELKS